MRQHRVQPAAQIGARCAPAGPSGRGTGSRVSHCDAVMLRCSLSIRRATSPAEPSALCSNSGIRRPSSVSASLHLAAAAGAARSPRSRGRRWRDRRCAAWPSAGRDSRSAPAVPCRGTIPRNSFSPGRRPVKRISTSSSGLQPGQTDHLPRQIDDLHRLAHVEHEDAAVSRRTAAARRRRQHAGLQHQADRLAHRHEVALHVGMRDRQRAAARELALEQRHHRAGAAEHIAEPHGDAAHALVRAGCARAQISSAWQYISASRFEAPITRVGFTALSVEISTIASAPDRARRVGDVAGAGGVGQPGPPAGSPPPSARASARRRGTPVRGGARRRSARMRRLVADVGDQATAAPGMGLGQFQVDLPQRVFAVVEQHQRAGPEARRPGARARCRSCRRRR